MCLNVNKSNLLENVELVDVGGDKAFTLMKKVIQQSKNNESAGHWNETGIIWIAKGQRHFH